MDRRSYSLERKAGDPNRPKRDWTLLAIPDNLPRRNAAFLLAGLTLLLLAVALGRSAEPAKARPNFVVMQTDDQTARMLHSRYVGRRGDRHPTMPNILRLLAGQGVEFTNYYASIPVCSPSRSALLSGQYGHTSGLIRNLGPLGGARGLARSAAWDGHFVAALDRAGYYTAHFGRLVNLYGNEDGYDEREVPPGWDYWATNWTPGPARRFYGYRLNLNGEITPPFGKARFEAWINKDPKSCPAGGLRCDYHTDQVTTRALRLIRHAPRGPLYVQIDFQAPHGVADGDGQAEPASRHIGSAARTRLPRPPGFNEVDISDKPPAIRRGARRLTRSQVRYVRKRWQNELESLRAVDESVGRVIRTLRRTGRLRNTYVFFLGDNGAFFGEHRYPQSKFLAYEPATNVPMVVRGPGVKRGRKSGGIVSNVDVAPTIAELAGAELLIPPDGRWMKRLLRFPHRPGRRAVVLESYRLPSRALYNHLERNGIETPADAAASARVPAVNFAAIRAGRYKYIDYEGGGRELYDLRLDPGEVSNRIHWRGYRRVVRILARQMKWRRFCAGVTCRKGTGRLPLPKLRPR